MGHAVIGNNQLPYITSLFIFVFLQQHAVLNAFIPYSAHAECQHCNLDVTLIGLLSLILYLCFSLPFHLYHKKQLCILALETSSLFNSYDNL